MAEPGHTATDEPSPAMEGEPTEKPFGIRITLTESNPMRRAHLLGDEWESVHWFASAQERDDAYADMTRHLPNYRQGDTVGQVFEKIQR
jgi:hypothetical protein